MLLPTLALPGEQGQELASGVWYQETANPIAVLPFIGAVILTVESEEEEESDSSETEKEDDEGIIFVARATSEVLQEGKVSGNDFLAVPLLCSWLVRCLFSWPLPQETLFLFISLLIY